MTDQLYMMVEPPISRLFMLLGLLIPGIWLLVRILIGKLKLDVKELSLLSIGGALAVWLLSVHIFGLISQSFTFGMAAGTLIPGLFGYLLYFLSGKSSIRIAFYRGHLLTALLCTALILPTILFWDIHDEIGHYGVHFSFPNEILNNIYPPRDFIFADQPLRYHYGIDTLFAMVMAITRLTVDYAIDVASIFLWFYMLMLYGLIGKKLFGQSEETAEHSLWQPAILLGAFSAGLPFLADKTLNIPMALFSIWSVNGSPLNPPLTSNFLQHAWALGFPFGLMALLCLNYLENEKQTDKLPIAILLAISLLVLSISNITLFLVLTVSLLLYNVLGLFKSRINGQHIKTPIYVLLSVVFVIAISYFISGFRELITGNPITPHARLVPTFFTNGGNAWSAFKWHLATFGLLLPVGIAALALYRRMLYVFTITILLCLIILNTFRYEASWDIVKFATVAQFMLAIQSAGIFLQWKPINRMTSLLKSFVFLGLITWGIFFHVPFLLDMHGHWWETTQKRIWQSNVQQNMTLDDVYAINWLRKRIKASEIVLCEPGSMFYAYFGGFPQFWTDRIDPALGFSEEKIQKRNGLTIYTTDANFYIQEGVGWVVVRKQTQGGHLMLPYIKAWINQRLAIKAAEFGMISIYKLGNSQH